MKKIALVLATTVLFLSSCTKKRGQTEQFDLFGGVWYTDMQGVNTNGQDMLAPANNNNGCGVDTLIFYEDGTLTKTTYESNSGECHTNSVQGTWNTSGTALTIYFSNDPSNPQSYFMIRLDRDELRLESTSDTPGTTNVSLYTREY